MKHVILIILMVASICSAEQSLTWFKFSGPKSCTVPFVIGTEYKGFVDMVVAEQKQRALLDTGAVTSVSLRLAQRLGLELVPTENIPVGLSGALGKHWKAVIDLQIGDMKLERYPVQCIDLTSFHQSVVKGGGDDFDVIVGADLLSLLQARLDYRKRKLTLGRPMTLVSDRPNK